MQAPDETDVATTRQREVTYWVDEKKGLFPLAWWKLLPIVALVGAATVAIMTLIMIPIYERQVINSAKDELTAAGIDPSAFSFDASYRDLDISGTLPAGVTVDDIRAAAERGDGQRDLDLAFAAPGAPVPDIVEEDDEPTPVVAATAPTDVTAVVTDAGVVLTGEVPSEAHRTLLVTSASKSGSVEVTDELIVLDLEATKPGANGRVQQLAKLLGAVPEGATGMATVTDDSFTSEWTVTSKEDEDAINTLVNQASGVFPDSANRTTDITLDLPPVAAEIESLQEGFNDLAVEIRENVTFATGSDVLNDSATETLDQIVDLMTTYVEPVVQIDGHTDNVGSEDLNLELSQLRAAAVRQYLIDAGIDADRLQSEGFGASDPAVSNETPEGRAENRRVTLTALETFVS